MLNQTNDPLGPVIRSAGDLVSLAKQNVTIQRPSMASLFTKIIDREIPADIVFEDDLTLAFRDIAPKAPTHVLIIPKKEILGLADLTPEDEAIVGRCVMTAHKVAKQEGLDGGYRLVVNCGDDGGQEVPHLHFHLLGGRKLTWPPG